MFTFHQEHLNTYNKRGKSRSNNDNNNNGNNNRLAKSTRKPNPMNNKGEISRCIFYGFSSIIVQMCLKGCVHYIFASLFLSLKESTCQTRINVLYFT